MHKSLHGLENGITELDDPSSQRIERQRRPGAGRKTREVEQPRLVKALELLARVR